MKTIIASRTVCIGCTTSPLGPYGPCVELGPVGTKGRPG
jgi:hypothetical protein